MRNNGVKRLQRVVAYMCATLFALFTFFFVSVSQTAQLEVLYDYVATGKLEYNGNVVAILTALALTLLAVWLNKLAGYRREWTAMAYLPSALILAFVTDIDRSLYTGGCSWWGWSFIFLSGITGYAFLAFILRQMLFEKIKNVAMSANRIIWRNLMIFVFLFLLVGTLSSSEENFEREALLYSHHKAGRVDKALAVGYKSLTASKELTQARAYILAEKGELGKRFFEYPQLYGVEGLLPGNERTSPLDPDSVYSLIGDTLRAGEDYDAFLYRVANTDTATPAAGDYYLVSLLLDKKIEIFKDEVARIYGDSTADNLPKHYREALVLYSSIDSDYNLSLSSDTLIEALDSLHRVEMKSEDIVVRSNFVRKEFGRTYWWYFLYGR